MKDSEGFEDRSGLLGGLTAYHLRILCESEWEGGCGYTPKEVGQMTLDQIWFRLCDKNILKTTTKRSPMMTGELKQEDGLIHGRSRDGKPITGVFRGKSKARQLMEEEEARLAAEAKKKKRKRKGR